MKIDKELLYQNLLYNLPIHYSEHITLYPITMKDIIPFQFLSPAIIVRKNSTFHEKAIIKMSYLNFLLHCAENKELAEQYKIPGLDQYFFFAVQLLQLCCKDSDIKLDQLSGQFSINGEIITEDKFDDLRRILIIQNDIDFDIDEFVNYDTEQRLLKAQKDLNKHSDKANIEDYIDSLAIALHITEEQIMHMSIRKFWRYIKRYHLHENYTIAKTGEYSGMVTFKEPIRHWMCSIEEDDRYKNLKTDEQALKNKIG